MTRITQYCEQETRFSWWENDVIILVYLMFQRKSKVLLSANYNSHVQERMFSRHLKERILSFTLFQWSLFCRQWNLYYFPLYTFLLNLLWEQTIYIWQYEINLNRAMFFFKNFNKSFTCNVSTLWKMYQLSYRQ